MASFFTYLILVPIAAFVIMFGIAVLFNIIETIRDVSKGFWWMLRHPIKFTKYLFTDTIPMIFALFVTLLGGFAIMMTIGMVMTMSLLYPAVFFFDVSLEYTIFFMVPCFIISGLYVYRFSSILKWIDKLAAKIYPKILED